MKITVAIFRLIKFKIRHEYFITSGKIRKDIGFFRGPAVKELLFEGLINLIHPSPFLAGTRSLN